MERLKAAVIGIGFIGEAHVEALRRIPYVDVVAIVDGVGIEEKAAARNTAPRYPPKIGPKSGLPKIKHTTT